MFLDIKESKQTGIMQLCLVLSIPVLMLASGVLAASGSGRLLATGGDGDPITFELEGSIDRAEVCFFDPANAEIGGCIDLERADAENSVIGFEDLVDGRIYGYFARVRFLESNEVAVSDTLFSAKNDVAVNIDIVNPAEKPVNVAESGPSAHSYPNPFSPREEFATIVFSPTVDGDITLLIYDLFGHLVYEETVTRASDLSWDGRNGRGELVAGGGYICVLKMGDEVVSKHKIAVIK